MVPIFTSVVTFSRMYVLFRNELTFLFCRWLFRGLRNSRSADEENEDKNKQEIRKKEQTKITNTFFLFCCYVV